MASIEKFLAKLETERVSQFGALTAEAVMRDYESMAKEIEAMGTELISVAKKCEALTTDVQDTIRDAAEAYRREGKKIFEQIEECALSTENVRKTCADVKRRMKEGNGGVQPHDRADQV